MDGTRRGGDTPAPGVDPGIFYRDVLRKIRK